MKEFLCGLLRGEAPEWPAASDEKFYSSFLEQSAYEGVDLLICHYLQGKPGWEQLPPRVKEVLDRRVKQAIAIELARANDLKLLHGLLEKAGIAALLLKGGALAYTHYPAPYLRTRVDTDIFIDLSDVKKIREVFESSGYQLDGWVYKSHQFKALKSGFGGQIIKYDVHWRSSNHASFALVLSHENALRNATFIGELGKIRTLSPCHALIQACLHRAGNPNHDPDRLIWIYDIHLLLSRMNSTELLDFANTAVKFEVQDVCLDSIQISGKYFRSRVNGSVLEALKTDATDKVKVTGYRGSQLALMMDDLRLLRGGQNKLEYLREFFFPPRNFLLRRYGKTRSYWLPLLYCRYLSKGLIDKISLR